MDFCSPLERLLEAFGTTMVVDGLLREPLHGAFEAEWFARFSPAEQLKLARPFLEWCETSGVALAGFAESLLVDSEQAASLSSKELRELLSE